MGECTGDFDNQMYVYMKKVLLAILMLTVGIYFLRATHSDGRSGVVEFVKTQSTRR